MIIWGTITLPDNMAILFVEFQAQGYKIRYNFGLKWTGSKFWKAINTRFEKSGFSKFVILQRLSNKIIIKLKSNLDLIDLTKFD